MKTLKTLTVLFFTIALAIIVSQEAHAQIKPNLGVNSISKQGDLVQGTGNKIKVKITNSGLVGVTGQIPVIMTLTQGRSNKIVQKILNGIGPNDNQGQTVMFDNLTLQKSGQVRVKVQIDPKRRFADSYRGNNTRTQTFTVESQPSIQTNGGTLNVIVCHLGSYQNTNNFQGISGAQIVVKRYNSTLRTGSSDSNGRWNAEDVAAGTLTVTVSRPGFKTKVKSFAFSNGQTKQLVMELKP